MSDDKILEFNPAEEAVSEGPNTITLVDQDGNEVEMAVVTIMEHEGSNYLILLPAENMESENMEIAVLKVEKDEETGEEVFVTGDTPDFDEVFEEFQKMLEEEVSDMSADDIFDINPES